LPDEGKRMKLFPKQLILPLLLIIFGCFYGVAQAAEIEKKQSLNVGVREVKPFIFIENEQEPRGFSVDLWQEISSELGVSTVYFTSPGIAHTLADIVEGEIDIAIGAITVKREREEKIDFSFPNFYTGLGILVLEENRFSIITLLGSFFDREKLYYMGIFLLLLTFSGHLIWLAERRSNHNFNRNYFPGVFEGIYWSIVTASTVGYGDYVPKSKIGRMLGVAIIIFSLPLFALFVGSISSDITLQKLRTSISGPGDLAGRRVGVIAGSTSHDYVAKIAVQKLYPSENIEAAYQQLLDGEIDAVVQDRPTLLYYQNNEGKGLVKVLDVTFDKQNYAIAMAQNSPYREDINRVLLKLIESGRYTEIREIWFGKEKF